MRCYGFKVWFIVLRNTWRLLSFMNKDNILYGQEFIKYSPVENKKNSLGSRGNETCSTSQWRYLNYTMTASFSILLPVILTSHHIIKATQREMLTT